MAESPFKEARKILLESRRLILESLGLPSINRPLIQALEKLSRVPQAREEPPLAEKPKQAEEPPGAGLVPWTPFPIRTALGRLIESTAKAIEAKAEAERLEKEAEKLRAEEEARRPKISMRK